MNMKSMRSVVFGALAGALVFFGLGVLRAQQGTVLTVSQFHSNSRLYVGTTIEVSGIASSIRSDTRIKNGESVPYTKMNLYEVDSKGKKTRYYIYIALPTRSFKTMPEEGGPATIIGPVKWPDMIGMIDP